MLCYSCSWYVDHRCQGDSIPDSCFLLSSTLLHNRRKLSCWWQSPARVKSQAVLNTIKERCTKESIPTPTSYDDERAKLCSAYKDNIRLFVRRDYFISSYVAVLNKLKKHNQLVISLNLELWIENLNSYGQHCHQYQQNQHS
jgi:hypothetical protein